MTKWEGQVSEVREVEFKKGLELYSFKLQTHDQWFSLGKIKHDTVGIRKGVDIRFTERNMRVDTTSIEPANTPITEEDLEVVTAPAPPAVRTSYLDTVGERIQYQAARRDATSVIVAALHTDSLPWASNAAKAKRLDLLRGYINELTTQMIQEETKHG